ncbi:MAG TPA: PHP domain-containing protein [Anaerolineales bacterium]|nr:PHP domain-containing protein [Anaerolineales bacterium]
MNLEFHCHTIFSKDSLTTPEKLIKTCRRKGIDRVIITDHNTIAGARGAQALDPERVIVGEEIMTTCGEILAAYVREGIPAGLTPAEAIRRLRDQGAFISVSHPFDRWRNGSWRERDLLEIIEQVDAIEVYNSRCMLPDFNRQARRFAERHALLGTVGSDAHAAFELGQSLMVLEPFEGPDGLRNVLPRAVHRVRWSPPWVHLSSRYAAFYQKVTRALRRLDTT